MDEKRRDEDQKTKRRGRKKDQSDDCNQIDSIIGSYGKYQFMIFLFKILIGATSALNNLGVTFYAPTDFVNFWCADTDSIALAGPNGTTSLGPPTNISFAPSHAPHSHDTARQSYQDSLLRPNFSHLVVAEQSPLGRPALEPFEYTLQGITQLLGDFVYNAERGERRASPDFNSDTPRGLRKECKFRSPADHTNRTCSSFKYDTGIWMSTIIDEWDLVCERSLLVSFTQSLYMSGFIVAYLMFGYLSDRFGRWNSLLLGAVIEISSGFGCAFATSVTQFMILRFLLGLGNAGRSSSSYLIMIEWTGQSWRMPISTLGSLGWVLGYCAMPWIWLYFLHFRHMQLFVCFYELALVIWLLTLPESPRWLLTHKRFDEAYKVLLKAAKFNGLIKPIGHGDNSSSSGENSSSTSSSESIAIKLQPSGDAPARKLEPGNSILEGAFARKRLNSISAVPVNIGSLRNHLEQAQESIILAPNHEVAAHVEVPAPGHHPQHHLQPQACPFSAKGCDSQEMLETARLQPYSLAEFDRKFARLAASISQKEFTKNEDRLSFIDLFRWPNLRKYTFILAFAWCCNSFIYYGIALRMGDFGGKNLFVSFSLAGATELPSIIFTILFMKFLPRKTTNLLMFSIIFLICAVQAPLKYYDLGGLQQTSMILAKLFNSCSFICILYQTMELFPTSIRQTAYSSCALAGRVGSILAPFIKELSQMTNNLVPPAMYALLSLLETLLVRFLPETQGSDLPDTLLEAEKFRGTQISSMWSRNGRGEQKAKALGDCRRRTPSASDCQNGARTKLPPA